MACDIKTFLTAGWCAASMLFVALVGNAASAQAQTTFRATVDDILTGVHVRYARAGEAEARSAPVLSDRLMTSLSFLAAAPRLKVAGDVRAVLSVEPQLDLASAETDSSGVTADLGARFMPAATLGVLASVSERATVGLFGHGALMTSIAAGPGDYGSGALSTNDSQGGAGDLGGEPGALSDPAELETNPGMSPGLPQDSWVGVVGLVGRAGLTPRLQPFATVQYRVFRYLERYDCDPGVPLDGSLTSQNYENDAIVLDSRWVTRVRDRAGYTLDVRGRRDVNRPFQACSSALWSAAPTGVFTQVTPSASIYAGGSTWRVGARPGVAFVWGRTVPAEGGAETTGSYVLPTATVNGGWNVLQVALRARMGLEAATLFGQATPTYNATADLLATWSLRPGWTLTGGAGWLRARPIVDEANPSGLPAATQTTLWTGSTGVEWHPAPWISSRMDYVVSHQAMATATGGEDAPAAGGTDSDRLTWHMVSLSASITLGGGMGADARPRFFGWQ